MFYCNDSVLFFEVTFTPEPNSRDYFDMVLINNSTLNFTEFVDIYISTQLIIIN